MPATTLGVPPKKIAKKQPKYNHMKKLTFRFRALLIPLLICLGISASAQLTVTGTVVDASGETLPGVSILLVGTTTGATTDFSGRYSINVPDGSAQLRFSFMGFATQIIAVGSQRVIDVTLLDESQMLGEVLVIGYGTMKKEDRTGAVAHITAGELKSGVMTQTVQSLQGKAAGVQISRAGGDPNAGFSVRIRGQAGIESGSGPLYVVDGVPGADPNSVAPGDIASFTILKDASATAIYGTRGANGVILITTKRGEGAGSFNINSSVSFETVARRMDLLSAADYRAFITNNGLIRSESNPDGIRDGGANTDWQDEIYRMGITTIHNVAYGAGTQTSSFRVSGTLNNFEGVIKGSSRQMGTVLFTGTHTAIDNRLQLEAGFSGTIEQNEWIPYRGNGPMDVLYQAFQRNPTDPVRNEDGTFFEINRAFQYNNPAAIIDKRVDERDQLSTRMNINARFEIIDGLKIGLNTAYTAGKNNQRYYIPNSLESGGYVGRIRGRQQNSNWVSKLLETTLSYDKTFDRIHNLNAVAGYSWQEDVNYGFNAEGGLSQSDFMGINNMRALVNVNPGDIGSWKNSSNLISFFGRAIYNYDQKYYFTGTLRRDGSSKFGANNKWGMFPSASVAWNILREDFMKGITPSWLDALRLRAGYGLAGNQNIDPYMSLTTYSITGYVRNPETDELMIQLSGDRNPNPDLKWEVNKEWNIGLDFGLWGGKLTGYFEYYDKTTSDLIARYRVPTPPNLFAHTFANGGSIRNSGFEATFQFHALRNQHIDWRTNLVFSTNQQTLVSLNSKDGKYGWNDDDSRQGWVQGRGWVGQDFWTQLLREGHQLGSFYLPEFADFSQDGVFLYKTAAGGITRDIARAQRVFAGSAMPKFEIGWSNYVTFFKHFDASMSLRAIVGHHVFNGTEMFFGNPWSITNNLNGTYGAVDLYNRGVNPIAAGQTVAPNTYFLEKATFLRLDEISIGYTLPIQSNKYIQRCRISFTANNLLTITGYTGLDPEVTYNTDPNSPQGRLSFGVESYNLYPRVRSFMFGVQLQF